MSDDVKLQKLNPASGAKAPERKRIPMSVPVQKLEVDPMPGYHLHWFLSNPSRIQRALDGGYEFVDSGDVRVNNTSLGGTSVQDGSTDMGSRVSIVSGKELGMDGQPERLILMKIRQEWHDEDQKVTEGRTMQVRDSLLGGMVGAEREKGTDAQHRYVDPSRTKIPEFYRSKRAG